ncbi:MAG: hypothetical protein ACPGGK_09485 [Pikeienuella sp.]
MEVVEMACELAVEQNTLRLPTIINLINQLVEPAIAPLAETYGYRQLISPPEANFKRYEDLFGRWKAVA